MATKKDPGGLLPDVRVTKVPLMLYLNWPMTHLGTSHVHYQDSSRG
jgi:hypothetical protein